jgi:hypothetical protein
MPIRVESGMNIQKKAANAGGQQKERQALEQEREESERIAGAEFRGHGSGVLVTLGTEEGISLREPYWRIKEYKENKALDMENKNKRLWVVDWKTGRSRAKVTAMTEPQHESPEIITWGQDRVEDGLAGVFKWRTDLILRVPRVERCDL